MIAPINELNLLILSSFRKRYINNPATKTCKTQLRVKAIFKGKTKNKMFSG